MTSKCGLSNNSPHELRVCHLDCHTILLHGKKCMANKMGLSGELLLKPYLLPILLYGTSGFKLSLTFALIDQSIRIYTVHISSIYLIFLSFYLLSGKWKFGNKELGVQIGSNFESHFSWGWRWRDIIRSWS